MFSLFIRRDGLIEPPEMDGLDTHCHILPGIDDGPSTLDGSLAIARTLVDMGIHTAIATPHVISDIYPNSSTTITTGVHRLKRELEAHHIPLTLQAGAEYYVERNFLDRIRRRDILCFGIERYVLFECPAEQRPMILEEILFELNSNGYTPLLAHAERYRFLQNDISLTMRLSQLGVRFQVNHPSFMLPKTSRRGEMARQLYVKGLVETLGTDMHRARTCHRTAPSSRLARIGTKGD